MKSGYSCVLNACVFAVILNLVLPLIAKPFATPEEITPPDGAVNLSFKSQIMHMLVHHKQVILTSSLIVAILVGLSTFLALKLI